MKAFVKINGERFEMNCKYLKSVGRTFTYFYIPAEEVTTDLLGKVGEEIPNITNNGEEWQVQVYTEKIEWED